VSCPKGVRAEAAAAVASVAAAAGEAS